MARQKILGYIVTSKDGAYCVGQYEEGRPVLVRGQHVDVFPTWRRARRLIDRSATYSRENGLGWNAGDYLIRPLHTPPDARPGR